MIREVTEKSPLRVMLGPLPSSVILRTGASGLSNVSFGSRTPNNE